MNNDLFNKQQVLYELCVDCHDRNDCCICKDCMACCTVTQELIETSKAIIGKKENIVA